MKRLSLANNRSVQAFSLSEVLVCVAIVGVLFVSLYSGISSAVGFVQLSRENLRATQILQERMETIRLYTFEQVATPGFIPTNFTEAFYSTNASFSASTGDFIYRGTVSIGSAPLTESYSTNLRSVSVTVNWTSGRVPRSRSVTTFIAKNGLQSYIY